MAPRRGQKSGKVSHCASFCTGISVRFTNSLGFQVLRGLQLQRIPRKCRLIQSQVERRAKNEAALHRRPNGSGSEALQFREETARADAGREAGTNLHVSSKALAQEELPVSQVLHAAEALRPRVRDAHDQPDREPVGDVVLRREADPAKRRL